jgi:uracil-DNA glycosylase
MKLALLGEAWGREEAAQGQPFVGSSGYILNTMLRQIGIARNECLVTNVFNLQPEPSNDIANLCGPKADGIPGLPPLSGKYVRKEYAPELERLKRQLADAKPNLVVAFGATAAWALLGTTGIRTIRGAPLWSDTHNVKVLPTYHPAAVMRDWGLRPIVLADLDKAKREQEFPDVRRPERYIYIEPSLADLALFEEQHINPSLDLSIDIETKGDQITCIGFATDISHCLVVPFYDPSRPDGCYWPSVLEEKSAWSFVRRWCGLNKRIVFQNGMYDMHFLWRRYGIPVPHASDDTMLLHHALQPELQKGLGFLGSVYTNEASWKFMRNDHETVKRED